MAGVCTKYAGRDNLCYCEFVCDTVEELMNDAPTTEKKGTGVFKNFEHCAPIGSACLVGNNGDMKVYILFSNGWQEV